MNLLKQLDQFFKLSDDEKEIFQNEIRTENTRRIFYLSLVAIPISIGHIVLFGMQLPHSTGVEHTWRALIFFTHILLVLFLGTISLSVYHIFFRRKKINNIINLNIFLVSVLLMIGGAAVSAIDQLVTSAINPFIITIIVSSIILLIRPLFALIFYAGSYIVFYFLINLTQDHPDVLISNLVNGISFAGLGLCLSFIFWKMNMSRIKQHKLIEKQKNELEENYNTLKYYSEQLKESNTTKDKLISVIAHDIKSPLSSLINITHLITEDIHLWKPEEIRNMMISINKETNLTFESLNNLLIWVGRQRKQLKPNPVKVNLGQITTQTYSHIENLFQSKKISFENRISDSIEVWADIQMLDSVLKNILLNGIKFTRKEGRIQVNAIVKDGFAEISIQDNGIGMNQTILSKLFSPNQEFTTPGTDNEKGTGLGLQICKEFIELNGGKIWVNSAEGTGSTFYFTVPLAK